MAAVVVIVGYGTQCEAVQGSISKVSNYATEQNREKRKDTKENDRRAQQKKKTPCGGCWEVGSRQAAKAWQLTDIQRGRESPQGTTIANIKRHGGDTRHSMRTGRGRCR